MSFAIINSQMDSPGGKYDLIQRLHQFRLESSLTHGTLQEL